MKTTTRLLLATLLFLTVSVSSGQENCGECHEDVAFDSPAHPEAMCTDCHTNVPPEHDDSDLEPLTDEESCGDCHRRPLREIGRSAHAGESACGDCHGDPHFIHEVADPASAVSAVNQVQYCGACHDEPPELVESFLVSEHGKALLLSGLAQAPSCASCHGAHDIRGADNPRDPTSHAKSPEMCGSCHVGLLEPWQTGSAHGMAWQEGNEDAPVCVDCHSSHGIADPAERDTRLASAGNCGGCHEEQHRTFSQGFHGKAINLGMAASATCADCHTPHRNLPADHPESTVHQDNLVATCGACHEGISASFVSFDPHNDPTDPDDNFIVYVVWAFMIGLLLSVFGFFAIHDTLWLQRAVVGVLRGEYEEEAESGGQYVRRFSKGNIWLHVTIIVTFLLLALTGLPLRFDNAAWAQQLITLLGGLESARIIHRIAAIGTFAYAAIHLGQLFARAVVRREKGLFWGPNSMVPQPKDFADLVGNFRHFIYLGDRPQGDRWNYIEKFDYLAVFWGVMMIGLSGLMLWAPIWFTQFVPGWVLNAAYVVHSDEALLATGFIFIFHFFHTHLRPESFPMDIVIFTGKVSLERFKAERPLEYQRLVDSGELESYLVDPPTASERRNAYFWGSLALFIGLALAIGIITALLTSSPAPQALEFVAQAGQP
ncbi:MAG: cytochrome c3 family protein [Woeseiaceae bacterium]|nr:cytochrome c3 family protein [Woeseiaceae bacterium]